MEDGRAVPRIFIVEDKAAVACALERLLRSFGYEVVGVADEAERALEAMASAPVDLLLTDIHLKGDIDGIVLAERCQKRFGAAVVFLTGYTDSETVARAARVRPYSYLVKPYSERELHASIEIALYRRLAEGELARYRRHLEELVEERTAELRGSRRHLEEALAALKLLSGMVFHDLGTPLSVVAMSAAALIKNVKDESQLTLLRMIEESSKRMCTLVNDLLDMPEIGNGRIELRMHEIDIAETLADVARCARFLARDKMISIHEEVAPGAGVIQADPDRLRQILDNLISNAVKYSPTNTTVTLGARRETGRLEIWVQNQGAGVSPGLFDARAQSVSRSNPRARSHGLGLAIAKRLVELQNGTIRVDSEPGKGARFTVALPLA